MIPFFKDINQACVSVLEEDSRAETSSNRARRSEIEAAPELDRAGICCKASETNMRID